MQMWGFIAFALAFAVKTPLFPFHTWLPDAHVQAPTAGSIILAGVLLKMGTYGYLRLAMPIFPDAGAVRPRRGDAGGDRHLYGALVALMQKDIKSLVAYSSVAHLGYVMLGLVAMNAVRASAARCCRWSTTA
jgi:NADH-quinone oxidoreductase subunit M